MKTYKELTNTYQENLNESTSGFGYGLYYVVKGGLGYVGKINIDNKPYNKEQDAIAAAGRKDAVVKCSFTEDSVHFHRVFFER